MDANPTVAQAGWPSVIVMGASQTGVVLMRNLARRSVSVSCMDASRDSPGFRTVYGKAYLCPDPDDKPAEWLAFLLDISRKSGSPIVLIPAADQYVSAIAAHAGQLRGSFLFAEAAGGVQAMLATKQRQYALASKHGLPSPRTQFVQNAEELAEFAGTARFPCILKPLHARAWERFVPPYHPLYGKKLMLANSVAELRETYRQAVEVASGEMVAQEVIEGPDTAKVVYLSCYSKTGERIGACLMREVRTVPIYFGSASVVEPMRDAETDGICDRFLRSIGYAGICEIELKRDSRDGIVKIIEANPRYSVTADAAPYAGVDLGWLHYLDLIGQHVTPVEAADRNFRHIVLNRDFATIRDYRRAGLLSWSALIRSYRPPVAFFDFDPRDWRNTAFIMVRLARLLFGPAIRRMFPKRKPEHSHSEV